MFKLKKLISLIMICAMIMGMSATAFAGEELNTVENAKVEVVNLSDDITDKEIQEIKNSLGAALIYYDGTAVPINSVITIEDISTPSYRLSNSDIQNSYKITLNTSISEKNKAVDSRKINSDNADLNGNIVASATLQLIWTDGPKLENIIDKVSGTLTVQKGKVSSGYVRYGNGGSAAILWEEKNVGSKSSFSFEPGTIVPDPTADYSVNFADSMMQLYMYVSASVFQ